MVSYVINLRTECTKKKLGLYINRFFIKNNFKSKYICVQLNFHDNNNNIKPIGDLYFLDTTNESEIQTYRFFILQYYVYNYLPFNNDILSIMVFNYRYSTRKEYINHISKFYKED